MPAARELSNVDYNAFARDLNALREELDANLSEADLRHLRKLERWGRLSTLLGYATAWLFPNPLSAFLMSTGTVTRWTIMMHHVGHKGYDKVPNVPARYTSKGFAQGWRRFLDFFDWLLPEAWSYEHNILHHYRTGEEADPDLVQQNIEWMRNIRWPAFMKYLVVAYFSLTWKWTYYLPRTVRALHYAHARRAGVARPAGIEILDRRQLMPRRGLYNPRTPMGRDMVLRSLLAYGLFQFVLVPSVFLLVGPWAAFSVLCNVLMAEAFTNLHSFLIIVPNHCGDDVYRFEQPMTDRAEFYVRAVVGSVNYRCGGDLNDFLHGFLNYQIEHHLWPDLPALKYQEAHPRVRALCEKHGVPYIQEPVLRRVRKTLDIMIGRTTMPVAVTTPRQARRPSARSEASSEAASVA
ncbi:MAG: fatty acid desaturase [Myxococcota bacterium]